MYKIARLQIYLILFSALFLQGSVLNYAKILGAKPDMLLAVTVFFGLFSKVGDHRTALLYASLLFLPAALLSDLHGILCPLTHVLRGGYP